MSNKDVNMTKVKKDDWLWFQLGQKLAPTQTSILDTIHILAEYGLTAIFHTSENPPASSHGHYADNN
jgi:hypothetical protein